MRKNTLSTKKLAVIGVMSALVFTSSHLSINLPGDTRLHLGNIMCLLAGFLLGPVGGGLAAGIGSGFFDLTSQYVRSLPFTLVFKFLMGFVAGAIAHGKESDGNNPKRNFIAAISGQFTYIILYVGKNLLSDLFFSRLELATALLVAFQKLLASSINGIIAVAVAVPLAAAVKKALVGSGQKLY